MSEFIRLSHTLKDNTPTFPGNPKNEIKEYHNLKKDGVETHIINLFTHNGTHIDLPKHYLNHNRDISCYSIKNFVFNNVQILDFQKKNLPLKNHKDLLLIRSCIERGSIDYSFINEDVANEICKFDYRCVGIDTLSITNPREKEIGENVHKILFKKGIFIIEDMDFSLIDNYKIKRVFAVPLFVKGLEASPCTVFAEVDE